MQGGARLKRGEFAHFALVDGQVQERGPWIAGPLNSRDGLLYLVSGATSPQGAEAASQALLAIQREWSQRGLSATRRLILGLRSAHLQLLEANRQQLPGQRYGLGITCLLLRPDGVYLAQAGPTAAWLATGDGVERLAAGHAPGPLGQGWLGLDEGLDIGAHNLVARAGDRLHGLLVSSYSLADLVQPEELAAQLARAPHAALTHLFLAARERGTGSVLAWCPPAGGWGTRRPGGAASRVSLPERETRNQKPETPVLARIAAQVVPRFLRAGLALVLLLFLLAGVAVAYQEVPGLLDRRGEAEYEIALAAARDTHAAALSARDRTGARQALLEASARVATAVRLKSRPEARDLQQRIEADLRRAEGVTPLRDLRPIDAGGRLSRLTGLASGAAALDPASARAVMLNPAGGDERAAGYRLLRSGTATEEGAGRPLDLFWMPAGGLRTAGELLLIDDRLRLFAVREEGPPVPLTLRAPQRWSSFTSAVGFSGNLYVLDPAAHQVWRYFPTEGGYDSEMRGLLESADLTGAVDFAMDGSIYILFGDGRLQRYLVGRQQPFPQDGLDRPLQDATAIYTSSATRSVYVIDRGNRRVVVFDKEGGFRQQLTDQALDKATDLVVDEERGLLLLLIGDRVWFASLLTE
ncbi:MAG: hypothetical protein HYY05_05360 [Chloroflexi bacterium]|nr:hypothetical protein [Chloroflexota bacterium]